MEVHLSPELEARLDQMSRDTGRPSSELIEDAVIGYFEELAQSRDTIESRYDDLESGRVEAVDGEEAYRRLMARTAELRRKGR